MHVNTKKIAFGGVLAALTVVLMLFSVYIEVSSLFFIIGASYCVGIAIREWGIRMGFVFWIASCILNLIVLPNKFYCLSFAAMGLYLVLSELLWEKIADKDQMRCRTLVLWLGKYVIFNAMYVPILFLFPELLITKPINGIFAMMLLVLGQVALLVYDRAYVYFQGVVWGSMRGKILRER